MLKLLAVVLEMLLPSCLAITSFSPVKLAKKSLFFLVSNTNLMVDYYKPVALYITPNNMKYDEKLTSDSSHPLAIIMLLLICVVSILQ